LTGVDHNGYLYAIGGRNEQQNELTSIERLEIFNPAKWEFLDIKKPKDIAPRFLSYGLSLDTSQILLFGGMTSVLCKECLILNTDDKQLTKVGELKAEDGF